MPKIIQLDRHVADLIAAGEVVERPASAVKELVENSIDADAKNITIELQNGGMTFLRITDDGCGMDPVDARTAFLRHATSKIRRQEDLACIGTLGFRGRKRLWPGLSLLYHEGNPGNRNHPGDDPFRLNERRNSKCLTLHNAKA